SADSTPYNNSVRPPWIYSVNGIILHVRVQINIPTSKPQRVFADEPANSRIIVPCTHVVKAVRLDHNTILADILEGLGDRFLLAEDLAERVVGVTVHYGLGHVGDGYGAAGTVEMVAVAGGRCHQGKET